VKKGLQLDITLYTFLQILNVTAFEKIDILQMATENQHQSIYNQTSNQLNLFDL
jgi:hypothetical protein